MGNSYKGQFINKPNEILTERYGILYPAGSEDVRSEYYRDYTRILHSNAYRRLKHKTQVFYNIANDHVCTRIEHVQHVESVSYSIALGLGLDTELTRAIACGHDLGHAPFGHEGETVINNRLKKELSKEHIDANYKGLDKIFWHERNGLRFVDSIELLPDNTGSHDNLHLTFAVRDGIISHCGEVDHNRIKPRDDMRQLYDIKECGTFQPFTWEGCVVKLSDKIAYIGRDIEDAEALGFLGDKDISDLKKMSRGFCGNDNVNTTTLMHSLIKDIIENSTPEDGLVLSDKTFDFFKEIKNFNYERIYRSSRFNVYKNYVNLIINSIYDILLDDKIYKDSHTIANVYGEYGKQYSTLVNDFIDYVCKYTSEDVINHYDSDKLYKYLKYDNEKIYGSLATRDDYVWAVTDFISGMTDKYAISLFDELITL